MVLCAMFTALVAVCSQIAVPMPWGVPINLALFAVYMAGTMLGPVWGTASQVVFIALAAIGVPVLANFQGGPSAIFGKTGGYAIGYILAALLTALLTKALGRKFWSLCVAMVVGCAACYVLGTIWFMFLTGADLVSALGSVSYTHLDVYKRQVIDRAAQIGGVPLAVAVQRGECAENQIFHGQTPCLLYTSCS